MDDFRYSFAYSRGMGGERAFADSSKIEALRARTPTQMVLEDRQALEHGLRAGLGALHLTVTRDQYRRLLR